MKKITLVIAIMISLTACKKENPVQGEVVTPVDAIPNPNAIVPANFYETHGLYDGVGIVSKSGKMNYNILMPELQKSSYSFVKFYNLGNNVLFMQMQNTTAEPLSNIILYTLRENIQPLEFNTKKNISVFLYYENGAPLTLEQAQKVYRKGCSGMTEPKKCGTGVLTFAEE